MRKFTTVISIAATVALGGPVMVLAQAVPVDGQVMKIDESAGKITLKHGPIKNLDMDSMTMVLRVKDPAMLKAVKVGDKVRFEAERVDGAITVTKMQKAR